MRDVNLTAVRTTHAIYVKRKEFEDAEKIISGYTNFNFTKFIIFKNDLEPGGTRHTHTLQLRSPSKINRRGIYLKDYQQETSTTTIQTVFTKSTKLSNVNIVISHVQK